MSPAERDPCARLEVEHLTAYRYASPVDLAQHLACLRPREDAGRQRLLAHALTVEPEPDHQVHGLDAWGNAQVHLELARPHEALAVRARSVVEVQAPRPESLGPDLPWEEVREAGRYRGQVAPAWADALVWAARHPSPFLPAAALADPGLAGYARASFRPGRPLREAARELMHRIHADFRYAPASTEVNTPVLDVLARREGVCQDFAHLMIAMLRSLGLAAAYISGYLLTQPPEGQPRLVGADASHAWLALACPRPGGGGGWLELDPTNDQEPALAHVRLACGRDYGDVTPLRGVIRGGGSHTLSVQVTTRPAGGA